jgi:hypothetical protein
VIIVNDPSVEMVALVSEQLTGQPGMHLSEAFERFHENTGQRVVLIIDQLEERLTQPESQLAELWSELATVAHSRTQAGTVVLSIREDHLADLTPLTRRVPGLVDRGFRVPRLEFSSYEEIVNRALAVVGPAGLIEPDLVDRVLEDLVGAAPEVDAATRRSGKIEAGYFQLVWKYLWDHRGDGPMRHEIYRDAGGTHGILDLFVTETLGALLPIERALLRAVTRYLILPSGAKVAMSVDDLAGPDGLLDSGDFAVGEAGAWLAADNSYATDERWSIDQYVAQRADLWAPWLERVFRKLEMSRTPLFRRVSRHGQHQHELMHDLVGRVILQWRSSYRPLVAPSLDPRALRDVAWQEVVNMTGVAAADKLGRTALKHLEELVSAVESADPSKMTSASDKVEVTLTEVAWAGRATAGHWVPRAKQRRAYAWVERFGDLRSEYASALEILAVDASREDDTLEVAQSLLIRLPLQQSLLQSISQLAAAGADSLWRKAAAVAVATAVALVAAVAGLVAGVASYEALFGVPSVEYFAYSMTLIVLAGTLFYCGTLSDVVDSGSWTRNALVMALPLVLYRQALPYSTEYRTRASTFWTRLGIFVLSVLLCWPIHWLTVVWSAFAVADLADLFELATTPWFNIGLAGSAVIMGGLYFEFLDDAA